MSVMRNRRWTLWLLAVVPLLGAGCLKTKFTIELADDGSATVTERLWFSAAALELDAETAGTVKLEQMLTRKAALARMKHMGKGIKLVRHKAETLPGDARQSVAVFRIADAEELILANPFLSYAKPSQYRRLKFGPNDKFVHSWHRVGALTVNLVPVKRPPRPPRADLDAPPPRKPSPLDLQRFRQLQPVFAEMLDDFEVEVKLIATRPVCRGHIRDLRAGTKTIHLLKFTGKDLDRFGGQFVDNEELMLKLLQADLNAEVIADHVQGFAANKTLPVLRCRKPYASTRLLIWPSKALFRKYYAGRPKSQGGDQPG